MFDRNPSIFTPLFHEEEYIETRKEPHFENTPILVEIRYRDQKYSLDGFKSSIPNLFRESFEIMLAMPNVYKGDYLYRAINQSEWHQIQERGFYLIRERDNFEKEVGSQVSHYLKEKGHAGVIIKIPRKGPYFAQAGFQVPRWSCVFDHYVKADEIFVSETGKDGVWIPLPEYLKAKALLRNSELLDISL